MIETKTKSRKAAEEGIPSPLYYHKETNTIRTMSQQTANLTVGERLAALQLFDEFKGSLSQTAIVLDDVKLLVVNDEKWTKVNLKKTPNPNGSVTWNWDEDGSEEDISISPEGVSYLKAKINEKSEKNAITLSEKALITLMAKLSGKIEAKQNPTTPVAPIGEESKG